MARPFMFAALCQRAHPLKHSLAESIFVSRNHIRQPNPYSLAEYIFVSRIHNRQPRPKKQQETSSLAEKFVSRVTRQPRYHCINFRCRFPSSLLSLRQFSIPPHSEIKTASQLNKKSAGKKKSIRCPIEPCSKHYNTGVLISPQPDLLPYCRRKESRLCRWKPIHCADLITCACCKLSRTFRGMKDKLYV